MKKLRVVRFQVQPDVVVEEDGTLTAVPIQPLIIDAKDWSKFTTGGFDAMLAELEKQLNVPAALSENRAFRRRAGKGKALS